LRLKVKGEWAHSNRKGLAPQKVAESYSSWATGNVFQRKVFYDSLNFFVFWWNGVTDGSPYYIVHKVSSDGVKWRATVNDFSFPVGPGGNADIGGNIDVFLKASSTCYIEFLGSNPQVDYPRIGTIANSMITWTTLWSIAFYNVNCVGGNVAFTPGARFYYVKHGRHITTLVDELILILPVEALYRQYTTDVPAKSDTTGGVQVLPYKTSSPYNLLILLKDANNTLYYSVINDTDYSITLPMTSIGVTLSSGFNSFCACSEAQNVGDPERIHLVYVKSTGELCYRKFENDAWSSEKVLVASGASYPVIAVGEGGRLYVFYVKDGAIKLLRFNVTWESERTLFPSHNYDNPTYLSTNQNVQNGKICLVWTEGSASPYKVMFAYLDDRWV
jgi:hypothetical protein